MANEDQLKVVRQAKARFADELLKNPDVHGVGVGLRKVDGEKTDDYAIVVHVQEKLEREAVEASRMLPRTVSFASKSGDALEVYVDVVEKKIPVPEVACGGCGADLEDRVRPVLGGYSGGPPTSVSNGGTLGGWVWDDVNDQPVLISNDHVLGGSAGEDVSQPSIFDGGSLPDDQVADVVRSGPLDVSIAAPVDSDVIEYAIECGGPGVFEIADATVEMVVQKTGQTTGLTCGIVELIDYDSGHYGSRNDLWIDGDGNDFSQGGDSGSLYLEKDHPDGSDWRRVVGIHWGGAGDDGIGHPIRTVFAGTELTTICTGVVTQFLDNLFGREEAEAESVKDTGLRLVRERELIGVGARRPILEPRVTKPLVSFRPRRPAMVKPFGRELEARLAKMEVGGKLVELVQRHRVDVVRVLSSVDGRRASLQLLKPLAKSVTTTDVLDYRVSLDDLENVKRLAEVVDRVCSPKAHELLEFGFALASKAEDVTLGELLA